MPRIAAAGLALLLACVLTPRAEAQDKIRFGKAFPGLFQFTPVDLGIEKGFFSKRGLDVEITNFFGDAKQQQAYTAGAIDMAIGGGAGMAFIARARRSWRLPKPLVRRSASPSPRGPTHRTRPSPTSKARL